MKLPTLILATSIVFAPAWVFAGKGDGSGDGMGGRNRGAEQDKNLAERLDRDFDKIDTNKDGQISRKELKTALGKNNQNKKSQGKNDSAN